jgi:hypothetical protein
MDLRADMVGDQTDDAFAVFRRQALARIGEALGEAVDPEPSVRVQHHLNDARVFQEGRDGRAKRGAQHSRAARDPFRIVM